MKCAAARALIDEETSASRTPGRIDDLALHLASCDTCRTYRFERAPGLIDDTTLLSNLLQEIPFDIEATDLYHKPRSETSILSPVPQVQRRFERTRRSVRSLAKVVLIGVSVVIALAVGGVALALAMIHTNVQALIVATSTAGLPAPIQAARPSPVPHLSGVAPTNVVLTQSVPTNVAPTSIAPTSVASFPSSVPQLAGRAPLMPTLLPTTQLPYPPQSNAVTILLLGSDLRPDETGNSRTDSVIIARVDPVRQRVALLSLPRDLIVSIPGYGEARINSANAIGGVDLVRSTVSNLLGIPIDYYATINFEGFIAIVDAVGGVDVNVETELYDPEYPTMDYGYTEAHFLPGMQHMDGAMALMYSRIRHPDSDYDRIKRQQAVLLAIATRLQQQNAIQSLQSLVTLSGALRGYVQTDMPEETMLGLAWSMRSLSPTAVERYSLGADDVSENIIPGDPYASFAVPGVIEMRVQQLLGTSPQ